MARAHWASRAEGPCALGNRGRRSLRTGPEAPVHWAAGPCSLAHWAAGLGALAHWPQALAHWATSPCALAHWGTAGPCALAHWTAGLGGALGQKHGRIADTGFAGTRALWPQALVNWAGAPQAKKFHWRSGLQLRGAVARQCGFGRLLWCTGPKAQVHWEKGAAGVCALGWLCAGRRCTAHRAGAHPRGTSNSGNWN